VLYEHECYNNSINAIAFSNLIVVMFSLDQNQVYPAEFGPLFLRLHEPTILADQEVVCVVSFFNKWSARFHDRQSVDYQILHSIYNHTILLTQKEKGKQCLSTAHALIVDGVRVISSVRDAVGEVVNGIETLLSAMGEADNEQNKAWNRVRQAARNADDRWNRCVRETQKLVEAIADVVEKWGLYDPGDRYQDGWATTNENVAIRAIRKMRSLECEDTAPMYDDGPIVFAVYYWMAIKVELLYLENGCSSEKLTIPDAPSSESVVDPVGIMSRQTAVGSAKATIYRVYEALVRVMTFSLDMYRWRCKWPEIYYCSRKTLSQERYLTLGDLKQTRRVCFNWIKSLSAMRQIAQQVVEAVDILLATVDQADEIDQLRRAIPFAYDLCHSERDRLEGKAANLVEALLTAECKRISAPTMRETEMSTRCTSVNFVEVEEACVDEISSLQQSELIDERSSAKEEIKDLQTDKEIITPLLKAFPDDEYNGNPLKDYRKLIWCFARVATVLLNLDEKVLEEAPEKVLEKIPENAREKALEKVSQNVPEKALEKVPENAREKVPENAREKVPQNVPEKALEKVPENAREKAPENAREKVSKNAPEKATEKAPSAVSAMIAQVNLVLRLDWF
jgi:hypothetical protein